ncbi:hypothetical protein JB92DRAFT_2996466, partial [Gautieria morchelliformis]
NLAEEQARCFPRAPLHKSGLGPLHRVQAFFSRHPHTRRPRGIDYLVMCQGLGAQPNGTYIRTSEGIEQHVAVQVLSRFMLGYALTVDACRVVKKGLMTVMKPGFR